MSIKFANFVSDPAVRLAARDHWRELFAGLPCQPMAHGWTNWGNDPVNIDATGVDLFGAKNEATRRGVALVQCTRVDTPTQVVAWTAWYGGDAGDPEAIAYIKINLFHTDETEKIALALMTRFVCGGASPQEMDALMHEMGVDVDPPRAQI
jgi:hypothetical protein